MFEAYTKIALAVDTCNGRVDGRKKLQKMIYIAKALGYPLREDFTLYWYGPHSHELTAELRRMDELNILSEDKPDFSYVFELTENGKTFLTYCETDIVEEMGSETLNKMVELFRDLSHFNPSELEILATLFYFYEIEHRDFDLLKDVVKQMKPKFNHQKISTMAKKMQLFIEKYSVNQ